MLAYFLQRIKSWLIFDTKGCKASSTLFRIDWHFNSVRIDAITAFLHAYIATRW